MARSQQRWPVPRLNFGRMPVPDYYRELRDHWIACAREARTRIMLAVMVGDTLWARKMRTDMRVAVKHARSVNRALVRLRPRAHTRRSE